MRKKTLKSCFQKVKAPLGVSVCAMSTALMCLPVFASETTAEINLSDTLRSGLDDAVNDFVGYVALVLPIGLTVFAATFGIKKAMAFFKNLAAKG